MRKRPVPASFPLLGLLVFGDASGYDLKKLSRQCFTHFWQEGDAQIYSSLRHFLERGWVRLVGGQEEGPRKVIRYGLTEAGRQAFLAWLHEPVESYQPRRNELLAKLFYGWLMDPQHRRTLLQDFHQAQVASFQGLAATRGAILEDREASPAQVSSWLMTVDYGLAFAQALVSWSQEALAGIDNPDPKDHNSGAKS